MNFATGFCLSDTNARFSFHHEVDDVNYNISGVSPTSHYWESHVQPFLDSGGAIEAHVVPVPSVEERREAQIADGGYVNVTEQMDVFYEAVVAAADGNSDAALLAGVRAYYNHIKNVKNDNPREE